MAFESQGVNPFLTDDDFSIPADNTGLNPFLSGGDFSISSNVPDELNPFLAGGEDFFPQDTGNSTNPFALFGIDENASQTFPTNPASNLFGITEPAANQNFTGNLIGNIAEPQNAEPVLRQVPTTDFFTTSPERPPPPRPQPVSAPTSLPLSGDAVEYCAETAAIFNANLDNNEIAATSPSVPSRPPPPRPAPPSKETQELILTVTGAMEATSSDLLDRLRATKTPSPTPIRDLHSPSPTPEMNREFLEELEPDLLGDETPAPPPPSANSVVNTTVPQTAANFMDLFGGIDDTSNHNIPEKIESKVDVQNVNDPFGLFGLDTSIVQHAEVTSPPNLISTDIADKGNVQFQHAPPPPRPAPPARPAPPSPVRDTHIFGNIPQQNVNEVAEATVSAVITEAAEKAKPPPPVSRPPPPRPAKPPPPPIVHMQQIPQEPVVSPPTPEEEERSINEIDDASMEMDINQPQVIPDVSNSNQPAEPPAEIINNHEPVSYQPAAFEPEPVNAFATPQQPDEFDAFAAKFESAGQDIDNATQKSDPFFDAFGSSAGKIGANAWGNETDNAGEQGGFGGEDEQFDAFLSMRGPPPVPQSTPARNSRQESADSDEEKNFSVVIRPSGYSGDQITPSPIQGPVPILAPPSRSPVQNAAFTDASRINPFEGFNSTVAEMTAEKIDAYSTPVIPTSLPSEPQQHFQRTDSQETPQTPLFDEDVSQPLEDFPRVHYTGDGWEMHLRQPNKKKITGQRFWKKVFVRLVYQGDNPVLQLSNTKDDKDPFQELPLQPCYSISDIGAQQFDQYGKIFTVKLQYVFYKERPGVRPGQVTKAERITNKLSQFAQYAIQGDYQGVKEFGSDLRKLGLPVEHAPQISQLLKIGSQNYEDMKQFSITLEEALFRMPAHRDRALHYKMEEVQITAVDEIYVEQDKTGHVCRQIARVRIFFLGFISGMPDLELGVNDIMRQGKEVVGRHDIIPVVTEEWIRLESLEFHSCVLNHEYEGERVIRFKPPDACYIELLRFRVRPPKNRELPLQLKCIICVTGNKIQINCDILVPGFSSRKLGQIPCEDIMVRIPIPECWIYLFRVEKHFRYGSVKSAHRRTGKIKGIERFLGTVDTLEQSLIEVTSGSAKYEHQHHAIVWRISRLPKEGQGAYTNHELVCRFTLTSYDQIPEELAKYCYLEFTMPSTQASHTTVRSLSVCGDRDEDPPEKCVRHLARLEYRIEIEHTQGSNPNEYLSATMVKSSSPAPVAEQPEREKDSDSDSSS